MKEIIYKQSDSINYVGSHSENARVISQIAETKEFSLATTSPLRRTSPRADQLLLIQSWYMVRITIIIKLGEAPTSCHPRLHRA
jgi:hypothetical protein